MDGIINLLKPAGMTSSDCVMNVRRIVGEKKVGHTGTLDPNACGVLPVCVGKATRLIEYMDMSAKSYLCEAILGYTSDTLDIWGETVKDSKDPDYFSEEVLRNCIKSLEGERLQYPPAYSAVKVGGKPLYSYARSGESVEVKPRKIFIEKTELISVKDNRITFTVNCSKGTYIRSLCADIGEMLGCGCIMSFLLRTEAAGLKVQDSVSLEELSAAKDNAFTGMFSSAESAVAHLPAINISEEQLKLFINGNNTFSEGIDYTGELAAVFCGSVFAGTAVWRSGRYAAEKVIK